MAPVHQFMHSNFTKNMIRGFFLPPATLFWGNSWNNHNSWSRSHCQASANTELMVSITEKYAFRNIMKVEMRNTSRKTWENEMRIGRVTKWGLGGWHECPATAALGEVWKFTLVSEHAEIRMNSKSTHSAPSIAKWLSWKPSKSNLPVLRVLETQPTSSSKWVGEPDYHIACFFSLIAPNFV